MTARDDNETLMIGILRDLQDDIRDMQINLRSVAKDIGSLDARVDSLEEKIESLSVHILHGNGEPSLLSRVASIETKLDGDSGNDDVEKEREVTKRSMMETARALGPYVFGAVALIIQLIRGAPIDVPYPPTPVHVRSIESTSSP